MKLRHILIALITACVSPISLGTTKKPVTFGIHEFQGRCFGYFRATTKVIDMYNFFINCPRIRIQSHQQFNETLSDMPFFTDFYITNPADFRPSCPFRAFAVSINTQWDNPGEISVMAYHKVTDHKNYTNLNGDYFSCAAWKLTTPKESPQIFDPQGPHGRSKAEQRRILAQFEREEREARRRQSKRPTASPAH